MNKITYKLTFPSLFEQDLLEVADYISNTLKKPRAAKRLIDDIEVIILKDLKHLLALRLINRQKLEGILTTKLI